MHTIHQTNNINIYYNYTFDIAPWNGTSNMLLIQNDNLTLIELTPTQVYSSILRETAA